MQDTLQFKKINTENVQHCPLCNMPQEKIVDGINPYFENDEQVGFEIDNEKGYSFCNCKNIFFTPWENMEQSVYDNDYEKKYEAFDTSSTVRADVTKAIEGLNKVGDFLEIGVTYNYLLDEATRLGCSAYGLDINKNLKIKYPLYTGSMEDENVWNKIPEMDIIWGSHVVEHLKDPIKACGYVKDKLKKDGYFCVAMPDPYFIPWENPQVWAHWHVKEHHIMWDMDSFIDEVLTLGFELVKAERRPLLTDFFVVFKKP